MQLYILTHQMNFRLYLYFLNSYSFSSSTLVLTVSIDNCAHVIVFILSIIIIIIIIISSALGKMTWNGSKIDLNRIRQQLRCRSFHVQIIANLVSASMCLFICVYLFAEIITIQTDEASETNNCGSPAVAEVSSVLKLGKRNVQALIQLRAYGSTENPVQSVNYLGETNVKVVLRNMTKKTHHHINFSEPCVDMTVRTSELFLGCVVQLRCCWSLDCVLL